MPFLEITTAHKCKSESGWIFVFGRDENVCDIRLLGDRHDGISKRQFGIELNFKHSTLIIKNLSRNTTRVVSRSLGTLQLQTQRAIPENEDISVEVGQNKITIRPPAHTLEYRDQLRQYCAQFTLHVPSIQDLNIESEASESAKTLGYSLGKELGSGTSATVFRAINGLTGDAVAMKQFHRIDERRYSDRDFLHIKHPNIVDFRHFTMWDGRPPTLVMELIDGLNLALDHKRQALTANETRLVLWQLLDAVKYLHSKGITHRDIKPANVLVKCRDPMHVKLTDFDLASAAKSLREKYGTPLYAAPEIFSSSKYTNKVDMWSLGVLALELSFGLPSYTEPWPTTLESYILCHISSPIMDLIFKLLQQHPSHRLDAAVALGHAFFTADIETHDDPFLESLPKGKQPVLTAGEYTEDTVANQDPASLQSLPDTEPWGEIPEPDFAVKVRKDCEKSLANTELWHNPSADVIIANLGIEFGESRPVDSELRRYNSPADLFNSLAMGSAARDAIDCQRTQLNPVEERGAEELAEAEQILRTSPTGSHFYEFPATRQNTHSSRNFQWDNPQQHLVRSEAPKASTKAQDDEDAGAGSHSDRDIPLQADAAQEGQANGRKASEGYAIFQLNHQPIACIPCKHTVNASQIVKSQGVPRHATSKFMSSHPDVERSIVKGHHTIQGTYIRIADVSRLCNHLKIPDLTDDIESGLQSAQFVPAQFNTAAPAAGHRRAFNRPSEADKDVLEAAFRRNPKPREHGYIELATKVTMHRLEIKAWFQNQRRKQRVAAP